MKFCPMLPAPVLMSFFLILLPFCRPALCDNVNVNPFKINTGRKAIELAVEKGDHDALDHLLQLGVDPRGIPFGAIPVQMAVKNGDYSAALKLLDSGADLFSTDRQGKTGLDMILEKTDGSEDPDAIKLRQKAIAISEEIYLDTAMTIRQAKKMLGYPDLFLDRPLVPVRIGILDHGFKGLAEWLETHPEEKERTHFAYDTTSDIHDHGFITYRLLRNVIPNAEIFIGYTMEPTHLGYLFHNNVGVATMAIGFPQWHAPDLSTMVGLDDSMIKFFDWLDRLGIFLFVASGNEFNQVYTVTAPEIDADGWITLNPYAPKDDPLNVKTMHSFEVREQFPMALFISGNYWDVPHELYAEVLRPEKNQAGETIFKPIGGIETHRDERAPGRVNVGGSPEMDANALLRLRVEGLAPEDAERLQIRILHHSGTGGYMYNGVQSASLPSTRLSPNLISVGSFGRHPESGKAVPSNFSAVAEVDIDHEDANTAGKRLVPHVLAPGELLLDNRIYQGTSYATPMLAAIAASFRGDISLSQVIKLVSDHDGWARETDRSVRGEWGIPVAEKLFNPKYINELFPPENEMPEISNFRFTFNEQGDIRVSFQAKKDMMSGMSLFFRFSFSDPETRKVLMKSCGNEAMQYMAWKATEREKGDLFDHEIFVVIGNSEIPDEYSGKKVHLRVAMSTGQRRENWVNIPDLFRGLIFPASRAE